MVSEIKYRYDFIGLSTDDKPTPATSNEVVDGSTFYESNTSKLYVWYNDQWYEKEAQGGGGTTYTAGDNIQISSDNVISATDTTYSAFTGTDGTAAGTSGLVPAPATTDAGKFLKADGTWDTAGADVIKELTSADYNYPVDNPSKVALNLLPAGIYYRSNNNVNVGWNESLGMITGASTFLVLPSIGEPSSRLIYAYSRFNDTSGGRGNALRGNYVDGSAASNLHEIFSVYDNLDSTSAIQALSANQGKVLKEHIDSLAVIKSSAPTTSTVGVLGQLYTDTTNMHTYQCTAISGNTYTWTQRW